MINGVQDCGKTSAFALLLLLLLLLLLRKSL